MRADKGPRTAAANRKPASGKLSSALTKLVQDELPPGFSKARSFVDSSDQDDNDVRLTPLRAGKGSKTTTANEKPVNGKLLLALTKLTLRIRQDIRAKKVLTLKTGQQKTDCG